jgi:hypothetical protein
LDGEVNASDELHIRNSFPIARRYAPAEGLGRQNFDIGEEGFVSVMELKCAAVGCPPAETVMLAFRGDGATFEARVHVPLQEITEADIIEVFRAPRRVDGLKELTPFQSSEARHHVAPHTPGKDDAEYPVDDEPDDPHVKRPTNN